MFVAWLGLCVFMFALVGVRLNVFIFLFILVVCFGSGVVLVCRWVCVFSGRRGNTSVEGFQPWAIPFCGMVVFFGWVSRGRPESE